MSHDRPEASILRLGSLAAGAAAWVASLVAAVL
jgi:hypothetical protein